MLGDYAKNDFDEVPDGTYVATVDDAKGEINDNGKCVLKVRFRIASGDAKGGCVFKDYYITEKTLEKFLPWQFGVLGIWHDVKVAKDFDEGLQVAVASMIKLANAKTLFSINVTTEKNMWEGKEYIKTNVIVEDMVTGPADAISESKAVRSSEPPQMDTTEDVPF